MYSYLNSYRCGGSCANTCEAAAAVAEIYLSHWKTIVFFTGSCWGGFAVAAAVSEMYEN